MLTAAVLLATAAFVGLLSEIAVARTSTCPQKIKKQPPVARTSAAAPTGRLTPVNENGMPIAEATLGMEFGASRGKDIRSQTFRLSAGLRADSVRVFPVNDFVKGTEPLPIGEDQLTYRAGQNPNDPRLVNVRVCYDPGGPREPQPGRYVGALLVSAPGARSTPLPLEFTFRDDSTLKVIIAFVIGLIAGTTLQAYVAFKQAPAGRPTGPWPYLFNFRTLFVIGAGVVAAIGANAHLVKGNPTFDGSLEALLPLAGATFAATVGGKTIADLKSPTEKEKKTGLAS